MVEGRTSYLTKLTLLFVVYFLTGRLGLSLNSVNDFATLIWAPTGIALAAMLVLGLRYWPGIALGALLVNLATGAPWPVALGIALGNTSEAVAGAYVLKRFTSFNHSLERVADVLWLVFLAAMASTVVSATVGVTSLLLGGVIDGKMYVETWVPWWVGDVLGALIVTPLLLVWHERLRSPLNFKKFALGLIPILLVALVSMLVFLGLPGLDIRPLALGYMIFPVLIGITLRFGQRGNVTALFVVACIAIWATLSTYQYSNALTISQNLLLLQSFIGITAATFMTMAAVVAEREQTQKRQRRLEQRTNQLAKQRARLEALNQAKDEFISIASHQLRTPATGVKQYLGMLKQNYAGPLNNKQAALVETAYDSNERQLKIIDDLLQVARVDAGKLRLNKVSCNLTELINDLAVQQAAVLEQRKQQLVFKPNKKPIKVHVDKGLLSMVLENLIDNASKYSPPDEVVHVSIRRLNGTVQVMVQDQGFGIPKKDQKRLFQKFIRVDSHFISGSGLGLYWAKKVIDMHGGTIELTSEIGKGSTFTILLPAD